jgi:hypothetical protein
VERLGYFCVLAEIKHVSLDTDLSSFSPNVANIKNSKVLLVAHFQFHSS